MLYSFFINTYFTLKLFIISSTLMILNQPTLAYTEAALTWQMGLQDSVPYMERIIKFHNNIMFVLIGIVIFVSWLLIRCIFLYTQKNYFNPDKLTHSTLLRIIFIFTLMVFVFISLSIATGQGVISKPVDIDIGLDSDTNFDVRWLIGLGIGVTSLVGLTYFYKNSIKLYCFHYNEKLDEGSLSTYNLDFLLYGKPKEELIYICNKQTKRSKIYFCYYSSNLFHIFRENYFRKNQIISTLAKELTHSAIQELRNPLASNPIFVGNLCISIIAKHTSAKLKQQLINEWCKQNSLIKEDLDVLFRSDSDESASEVSSKSSSNSFSQDDEL